MMRIIEQTSELKDVMNLAQQTTRPEKSQRKSQAELFHVKCRYAQKLYNVHMMFKTGITNSHHSKLDLSKSDFKSVIPARSCQARGLASSARGGCSELAPGSLMLNI